MRTMQNFVSFPILLLTTLSANSISITPDSLFESLDYGDTAIHSVTITNNYATDTDISIYMLEQYGNGNDRIGTSINQLIEKLQVKPIYTNESRDGEVDKIILDITKARDVLGWRPTRFII